MWRKSKLELKHQVRPQSDNGFFNNVPPEVILTILEYFNNPQTLAKLGRVSTLFYRLASDNVLWKKFLDLNTKSQASAVHSPLESRMLKKMFIQSSDAIRLEYAPFAPIEYQLEKVQALMAEFKQDNICGAGVAASMYQAVLEKAHKDKKTSKIKDKFFGIFKHKQTSFDLQKLQHALKAMNAYQFALLIEIIKTTDKMKANASSRMEFHGLSFSELLLKLFEGYGDQAAILQPGCLEKIISYLQTNPPACKLFSLLNLLRHEKLAVNPELPQLMDHLIEGIKSPMALGVTGYQPEKLDDLIVEKVLELQGQRQRYKP